jgi:hypothetical protein
MIHDGRLKTPETPGGGPAPGPAWCLVGRKTKARDYFIAFAEAVDDFGKNTVADANLDLDCF